MSFLRVQYRVESPMALKNVSRQLTAESSIGTWTEVKTMTPRIQKRLGARIVKINPKHRNIVIDYPSELFEPGNIPQLLSDVAGNIFGMLAVRNLRLENIWFPKAYAKSFPGPGVGINGIRKLVRIKNRPLIGTIVKPKVGLNPSEFSRVAYEAYSGGIDFVKDDENLTSQRFCKFESRVIRTLDAVDRIKSETGRVVYYAPNITAETKTMLGRSEFVKNHGGKCIMVDVLTAGFSALQTVRKSSNMIIHGHRAMHAALTRNPRHGISMLCLAKLLRLAGADQLHIGTVVGKMEGGYNEIKSIQHSLTEKFYGLKRTMPVASGGLHPLLVPDLLKIFGKDVVLQFGGGCHGHPSGTKAGAMAIKQALDASMKKIPLNKYSKNHIELKQALVKWKTRWNK